MTVFLVTISEYFDQTIKEQQLKKLGFSTNTYRSKKISNRKDQDNEIYNKLLPKLILREFQ
ncbi:MAG: hypothetical protein WBP64_21595 [Nitrososphaeraceae archaeon]